MAVLKPFILRITEVADATSKINHDEQTGTEVKDTPPTITEYATKYVSKSLPDLTNLVAEDANDRFIMLDNDSGSIFESQTDAHAYLEEQRRRLEALLGADRNINVRSFRCCTHFSNHYPNLRNDPHMLFVLGKKDKINQTQKIPCHLQAPQGLQQDRRLWRFFICSGRVCRYQRNRREG